MTGEFVKTSNPRADLPFSMIEQKGLLTRLAQELSLALRELAHDPRAFIRDLFTADTRDARRRRRIYAGLTCAVVIYAALFAVVLVLGWPKALTPSEEDTALKIDQMLSYAKGNDPADAGKSDVPRGDNGGGGGGGKGETAPATHGQLPQFSPQPSPVTPTTHVPAVPPLMAIQQTIQGDPATQPKFDPTLPIGDSTAVPTPPSPTTSDGPGQGGGIGNNGTGPGVGNGDGPGAGKGSGGGPGGKDRAAGLPDGSNALPTGPIDWNRLKEIPGNTPFSWVSRPRPVVTPETVEKKLVGDVLLRATFNANGTISDIEVVRTDVPAMTQSAIQSLARSTFRPATIKGVPVTVSRVLVRVSVHN